MKLVVDTPDLIDAVSRAARVSPKRGAAFDIAAGIQFEVAPPWLLVKASDLDVTYRQRVKLLGQDGALEAFRLPAAVLAAWMVQLPTGEGSQVEMRVERNKVNVASEASKAQFTRIEGTSFPQFNEFDPTDLTEVDSLGLRLRQVSWACDRDSVPLSGVHIDGEFLFGTDKAKMARVDCIVPVDRPVTAPLSTVASALRGNNGPVAMAVQDEKLLLMPDADTQITSTLYGAEYPDVRALEPRVANNTPTKVSRSSFQAALGRILALCKSERYPLMEMHIDGVELHLSTEIDELGRVEEVVTLETGLLGEFSIKFTPTLLTGALEACTSETVTFSWPESPLMPIKIEDGRGFQCIAMPRR